MPEFSKEIVLKVRDQATRALSRLQKVQSRIERATERVAMATQRVTRASQLAARASQAWRTAVDRVGRAYQRVSEKVRQIAGRLRGLARTASLAIPAAVGGATAAVSAVAGATTRDSARAGILDIDVNEFRRMREFLVRASNGLFDEGAATEFLNNFSERLGEAREETARAISEGKDASEASGTGIEFLRSLGIQAAVDLPFTSAVEELLNATRENSKSIALFLGREGLGTEGTALSQIAGLSEVRISEILSDIDENLRRVSKEDVENAVKFQDAMRNLRNQLEGLAQKVIGPLTPIIESVVSATANLIDNINPEAIEAKFKSLIAAINGFVDGIVSLAERLGLVETEEAAQARKRAESQRRVSNIITIDRGGEFGVDDARAARGFGRSNPLDAKSGEDIAARLRESNSRLIQANDALKAAKDAEVKGSLDVATASTELASSLRQKAAEISNLSITAPGIGGFQRPSTGGEVGRLAVPSRPGGSGR